MISSKLKKLKKHTKLDLTNKYSKIESTRWHYKFYIKPEYISEVKQFIINNWNVMTNKQNFSVPIQIREDEEYCSYKVFMFSGEHGAKTETIDVYIVDKEDEYYLFISMI